MPTGGEQMSFASNTSAYTLNPHPFTGQTMEPPSSSPSTWTKKRRRRRGGGGRKGSYFLKTSAHSIKNREMEGLNFFLRVQRLMWTSLISHSLINSPQITREVRPDYSFSKRCLNSVKKRENFYQTFYQTLCNNNIIHISKRYPCKIKLICTGLFNMVVLTLQLSSSFGT